jgi:hypothetical protein
MPWLPAGGMMAAIAGALLVGLGLAAGPAPAQQPQQPRLAPADALQLAQAAGFRYAGGELLNACGKPSSPRFAFLDLNGDGQREAIVIDRNPACYGAPGDWFAILTRGSGGLWRAMVRDVGTVQTEPTRTRGWADLHIKGACDGIWSFNGVTYVPRKDCVPASAATPTQAATAPSAVGGASSATALTSGDRDAVMRAAGFARKGGQWTGCGGSSIATIEPEDIRDLNGDGQTDVIVTDSGTECYGATGQGFVLVTRTASGQWHKLYASPGIPSVLKTSSRGWPDIEIGSPGFCFPVLRWNGTTYTEYRRREEQRGACRQH